MEIVFVSFAFSVPAILSFCVRSELLVILLGTAWFWLMMVIAGQYTLATDVEYNSLAPGISVVAGWLPGLIYATFCLLISSIVSRHVRCRFLHRHAKKENGAGFVVDGYKRALAAIEKEIRPVVERKYADEWTSARFIRRWRLRRKIEREIAVIVSKRSARISSDAIF